MGLYWFGLYDVFVALHLDFQLSFKINSAYFASTLRIQSWSQHACQDQICGNYCNLFGSLGMVIDSLTGLIPYIQNVYIYIYVCVYVCVPLKDIKEVPILGHTDSRHKNFHNIAMEWMTMSRWSGWIARRFWLEQSMIGTKRTQRRRYNQVIASGAWG